MPAPVPPSDAQRYGLNDAAAERAYLTFADLHARLREHYDGRWAPNYLTLPTDTTWESVRAHYDAQLSAPWRIDERYRETGTGYRLRVWSDGDRAVGIAYLESDTPAPRLLIVLVPETAGNEP